MQSQDGNEEAVENRNWEEFRECGMLWWINMVLHTFGWAIALEVEESGRVVGAIPRRVKFRGFSESSNTKGYIRVSQYMKDNAEDLYEDSIS